MTTWRAAAPGKVNLCLYLGGPRGDGLHDLVSVVESVSLADRVELAPAHPEAGGDELICPEVTGPNLGAEALSAFRARAGWDAPPQRITIEKQVPVAAGMGGGSADAAAVLRLAAAASELDADEAIAGIAPGLGADVPSQIRPGTSLITGAGEEVRRLPAVEPHGVLVLPLAERLETGAVFAEADRLGLPREPDDLAERRRVVEAALERGGPLPPELLHNDLERAARLLCPAIDAALAAAKAAGADRALVCGSGPTVVGVFIGPHGDAAARGAVEQLRDRFPRATAAVPVDEDFAAPQRRS